MLGWICAVHRWMLHTLRGRGFDCILTLISKMMEHPPAPSKCAPVCASYMMHTGAWMIRVVENGQSNWNDWTATYRLIWLYCHVVTEMIVLPRIEIYDCTVTWWDSCDWNDYAVTWRQKWLYCHLVTEMIVLPSGDRNDCTAIWWLKWLYCHLVTEMIVLPFGDWNDCTSS